MEKTLYKKILISIMIIFTLLFVLSPTNVKAVLQSKDGTVSKKRLDDWAIQIRRMQSAGGTLGLGDTINTTGLTSNNKNLDIHMQKNTEYGALVILSASSYGNPNKIADGQTTTGNTTGAVMRVNNTEYDSEWVSACAGGLSSATYLQNANARYINRGYTVNASGSRTGSFLAGDAITIANWHGGTANAWFGNSGWAGLVRGLSGSVFSYTAGWSSNSYPNYANDAYIERTHPSRAAIVIGSGI